MTKELQWRITNQPTDKEFEELYIDLYSDDPYIPYYTYFTEIGTKCLLVTYWWDKQGRVGSEIRLYHALCFHGMRTNKLCEGFIPHD